MRILIITLLLSLLASAESDWRKHLSPHAQKAMKEVGKEDWKAPQLTAQEKKDLQQLWDILQELPRAGVPAPTNKNATEPSK
jgi:hypothetical protein